MLNMSIKNLSDSIVVVLPSGPESHKSVGLAYRPKDNENTETIVFNRYDPFDIIYAAHGGVQK